MTGMRVPMGRGGGGALRRQTASILGHLTVNPLRPNNDLRQTSHSNINGVSVSEVMRIENKITPVKFY